MSHEKYRICFVFTFPVSAPKADFLTNIPVRMGRLLGDRNELHVMYAGVLNEKILIEQGIRPHSINGKYLGNSPLILRFFLMPHAVYRLAKSEKMDIFINANNHYYLFLIALAARLAGARSIGRVTGIIEQASRANFKRTLRKKLAVMLENLSVRFADNVFALSEDLRAKLLKRGSPSGKIKVISTGVDTNRFNMRSEDRIRTKPVRLLYVGRISELKGIGYAIDAFGVAKLKKNDLEFVICGDGDCFFSELKSRYASTEGLSFRGYVGYKDLPGVYRDSDVLILPSFSEGLPNVILEAMSSGVPVIATNICENPLLLDGGKRGILVEPRNTEQIVKGIETYIDDDDFRIHCARESRKFIEENHSFDVVRSKYLELFRETLCRK